MNSNFFQIYIELFGNGSQPADVPATVLLQVRHLSVSYFRAGDKTIKQYRQPLGSYRNIKFDRFTITDDAECQNRKTKGSELLRIFTSKHVLYVNFIKMY